MDPGPERAMADERRPGDGGQRPIEDAPLQDDALVPAAHRVGVRLHGGRGRTQHRQGARPLRPHQCHVTTVVTGTLVLLVRRVVFLVDHDESETREGREDGRAGADDDIHLTLADAVPLVVALTRCQPAVLDRDALADLDPAFDHRVVLHVRHRHQPVDPGNTEPMQDIRHQLLESRIPPAVASAGGDITFRGYKDGIVYLAMKGSCSGCPSSTATLKNGVQNLLRHFLPDVREVQAI